MTLNIKVSDSWKLVSDVFVKVAGDWKEVNGIFIKTGGVWKLVFGTGVPISDLNATIQNSIVSGSRSGAGSVTSSLAVGLPTGGVLPYSHSWSKVSGDTLTVDDPTDDDTTFSTSLTSGQTKSAVYRYTVTDSDTPPSSATADQTVNLVSNVPPPPPPPPPSLNVSTSPPDVFFYPASGLAASGQQFPFSASVSGGNGSYLYSWSFSAPSGYSQMGSNNGSSFTVVCSRQPVAGENVFATCNVVDTAGVAGSDSSIYGLT